MLKGKFDGGSADCSFKAVSSAESKQGQPGLNLHCPAISAASFTSSQSLTPVPTFQLNVSIPVRDELQNELGMLGGEIKVSATKR